MALATRLGVVGLLIAAVSGFGGLRQAAAQDNPAAVTVGADLEFKTRYLFAGIPFSAGEVIQAKITVGHAGWTLNAFTNYDLEAEEFSEGDVWAEYYHQFNDKVGGFLGAALYNFKIAASWEPTVELYAGLTANLPGNPTLYFAHDFALTTGNHVTFTLSHGIPVEAATVSVAGNIDYNNGYYREGSSLSYADLNVSVTVPVGDVTLTPMLTLQEGLHEDFEDQVLGSIKLHVDF